MTGLDLTFHMPVCDILVKNMTTEMTTLGTDYTNQVYLSLLANGGFYTDSGTEDFRDAGMYI